MNEQLLFVVLPYAAVGLLVLGLAVRGLGRQRSVEELGAGWASMVDLYGRSSSFKWGLMGLLAGHLLAIFLPKAVVVWDQEPLRLLLLETLVLVCGGMLLVGLLRLVLVRRGSRRGRGGALSLPDTLFLTLLAASLVTGIVITLRLQWGSMWYAAVTVPYLRSLAQLAPQIDGLVSMPFLVQLHTVMIFVLVAVLAFTRLAWLAIRPLAALKERASARPTAASTHTG